MSWDVKDLSIGKVSRIYVESIYYYIDDSVFYIWQVSRHCYSWNLAPNGLKLHHLTGTVFLPIEAFEFLESGDYDPYSGIKQIIF